MLDATWHRGHLMPKNATAAQRLAWHLQHENHCDCRRLTAAQRAKLEESAAKAMPARKKTKPARKKATTKRARRTAKAKTTAR